jgi:hypothetical protein
MAYTVAYQNDGFPSFYSFDPEMAIGMNNYLYTFKNGQIYKHGFGNKFYQWDMPYSFITHFNDSPTEIKMFKTLSVDGKYQKGVITADLNTKLSEKVYTGHIDLSQFERKEGIDYFNIISKFVQDLYAYSVNGIGALLSISGNKFTIMSGDRAYVPAIGVDSLAYATSTDIIELGFISAYIDLGTTHEYYLNTTPSPLPPIGSKMLVKRSSLAESNGLRGTSMEASITIEPGETFEIFSVSTDVFKSFP